MKRLLSLSVCLAVVSSAFAPSFAFAETPVSRRDGFLHIWETVRRAVGKTSEKPFPDVPAGSTGSEAITYAKGRGLLDDEPLFRPDDSLLLPDAALWLLRTRNVDDNDLLTKEALPTYLQKYPFVSLKDGAVESRPVTREELQQLAKKFNELLITEDHEVSLYSEKFHGKGTAFGETFDMYAMTAAHRTFPHNTLVVVTNIENGKSVTVRINDRGPFVQGRDMDLSLGAFTSIAERSKGKIRATFHRIGDASLPTTCAVRSRYVSRLVGGIRLDPGIPSKLKTGTPLSFTSTKTLKILEIVGPDGRKYQESTIVEAGGSFRFDPPSSGNYRIRIATRGTRSRVIRMEVLSCS